MLNKIFSNMNTMWLCVFLITVSLVGCGNAVAVSPKFKVGDIVCHKLTKQKGIVVSVHQIRRYGKIIRYKLRMHMKPFGADKGIKGSFGTALSFGGGSIKTVTTIDRGYFLKYFIEEELEDPANVK